MLDTELSGGPLGGTLAEWTAEGDEQTFESDGKKWLYRKVEDDTRSPHAVFCGELKDA